MQEILIRVFDSTIRFSFYLLFFLVPIIMTPLNYELFEYNKMMATYALTTIIVSSWILKMILEKRFIFKRSPLDIPLLLFLLSQIISTYFSIDRHVSIFGYYSRFNGGLLSTISYILLYYAFISNFPRDKIKTLLYITLGSGLLVSFYGILEKFGIDKNIWVQDVQNRVFSSLGQPNWLAAYLAVLIPLAIGLFLKQISNFKFQISKSLAYCLPALLAGIIGIIFYITLIFTKSRSGLAGFWIANFVFWVIIFLKYKENILKSFLILNSSFLILNFILGSPFSQFDKFTLSGILQNRSAPNTSQNTTPNEPIGESVLDVGITESGNIRKIVWKGAVEITKNYPLFGSGVETFAFSYYKYRPIEHNMTSEWDFLYNKAHNEYLNYAATTGLIGLGTYLLFIATVIFWNLKSLKDRALKLDIGNWILEIGLFSSWLSILITNFLGFSVVIVQIFFFLLPALIFVAINNLKETTLLNLEVTPHKPVPYFSRDYLKLWIRISLFSIIISFAPFLIYKIATFWIADVLYARGYNLSRKGDYIEAYQSLKTAINLNKSEPLYFDELSLPAAQLGLAALEQNDATLSSSLIEESIKSSNYAVESSPNNVNFYKTRTRVFYSLSQLDEKYLTSSIEALKYASLLSPTDPRIAYNLGLLYGKIGNNNEAITQLKKAADLKPDYRDAHFALALYYKELKMIDKTREELEFILKRINQNDEEAKKQLEEIK
ncbi:hypothetical protein A2773_06365 [Candidatus Gottesmanbacteria bacterium RIFCSPHIGHO2_01_FULL_39_10]|uniref:O-antigen ligase-related domain-containing protein n=1 Tax=Candidatus Gottesmanbacteria bacterium RIFCSPHIGHO2_01_FULL_39_10 TaxID=1798375 RepID=A0A1F5ZP50_9BACT|nr:MAG: hypothetical protein A2773_06365 [Candidatus Gottesmanbacteria bacterium RIFCSPHIGHO2_01_FULL_39_10]